MERGPHDDHQTTPLHLTELTTMLAIQTTEQTRHTLAPSKARNTFIPGPIVRSTQPLENRAKHKKVEDNQPKNERERGNCETWERRGPLTATFGTSKPKEEGEQTAPASTKIDEDHHAKLRPHIGDHLLTLPNKRARKPSTQNLLHKRQIPRITLRNPAQSEGATLEYLPLKELTPEASANQEPSKPAKQQTHHPV